MPNLYVTNLYIFVVWTCQIVNRIWERAQNKTFVHTVRFEHRFSRSLTSFKIILNILLTEFVSFRKLREGILRGSRANWNESSLHLTAILHPQRTTKSLWTFYFSRLLHYKSWTSSYTVPKNRPSNGTGHSSSILFDNQTSPLPAFYLSSPRVLEQTAPSSRIKERYNKFDLSIS